MSTDFVPVDNKTEIVNRTPDRQHSDSTWPVSFLAESKIQSMVETAMTRREAERNYLLVMGVKASLFAKGGRG
jgi:hypothetical protein